MTPLQQLLQNAKNAVGTFNANLPLRGPVIPTAGPPIQRPLFATYAVTSLTRQNLPLPAHNRYQVTALLAKGR